MLLCNHVEEAMANWSLKPMDHIRPNFSRSPNGCLPAVAQDAETGEVLMLAYMNEESFNETLETGYAVYFSRSRNRLWRKGEESGHVQQVSSIRIDCDEDSILLLVSQEGAACHEGYRSCFFREVTPDSTQTISERIVDPKTIYKS
jgi:phosphoribosyl-AMP cyclohydrolase